MKIFLQMWSPRWFAQQICGWFVPARASESIPIGAQKYQKEISDQKRLIQSLQKQINTLTSDNCRLRKQLDLYGNALGRVQAREYVNAILCDIYETYYNCKHISKVGGDAITTMIRLSNESRNGPKKWAKVTKKFNIEGKDINLLLLVREKGNRTVHDILPWLDAKYIEEALGEEWAEFARRPPERLKRQASLD